MTTTRMVIGGDLVAAADGRTFDVVEPHAGTIVASVPLGDAEDVDRAVAAARAAFEGEWSSLAASDRGRLLLRFAQVVRDHEDELARLESRQIGKPISGARWEVGQVAKVLEFYAGATTKIHGATIPVTRPGFDFTLREPIGVVGLIVPWNFPIMMAAWKVGPALAAGNTAVLKPASYSPLTALRLGELALEAGLPAGVLNVVTGPGPIVGGGAGGAPGRRQDRLHGRDRNGPEIMRTASGTIKKVSLELGGKSPNIVFADADIETFAAAVALRGLRQLRPGLLRAEPDHRRALRARARRRAVRRQRRRRSGVGDPADPATEVGPLVSFRQRERVEGYVRERARGGRGARHGRRPPDRSGACRRRVPARPRCSTGCDPRCGSRARRSSDRSSAIIPFDTEEEALAARQRLAVWPVGVDLEPGHGPGDAGGEGRCVPGSSR